MLIVYGSDAGARSEPDAGARGAARLPRGVRGRMSGRRGARGDVYWTRLAKA